MKPLHDSRVSIIIPTYNSSATLEKCLNAINNQDYSQYEVIVVDNYSTDSTPDIAEKFGVRVMKHRGGRASARNIGIKNASYSFILLLDSDHILANGVLRDCVEIRSKDDVVMVRIPEVFVGTDFWGSCSAFWKNCHRVEDTEPRFFVKKHMHLVGFLNEGLTWGEDRDLCRRLKVLGGKETWCKSNMYHIERLSVRGMVVKRIQYGMTIPVFSRETKERPYGVLIREALLALKKALKSLHKSPALVVGSIFLFCVKTCAEIAGFLAGLARELPECYARHARLE